MYFSTSGQSFFFTRKDLFESSSLVLVSTYCQAYRHQWVKVNLLQLVHIQITRKEATIQSRPIMSPAGNNNKLADYEKSRGNALYYPIFMGCIACSYNLLTSFMYNLNLGKFPYHFCYECPGYKATYNFTRCTIYWTWRIFFFHHTTCYNKNDVIVCSLVKWEQLYSRASLSYVIVHYGLICYKVLCMASDLVSDQSNLMISLTYSSGL